MLGTEMLNRRATDQGLYYRIQVKIGAEMTKEEVYPLMIQNLNFKRHTGIVLPVIH